MNKLKHSGVSRDGNTSYGFHCVARRLTNLEVRVVTLPIETKLVLLQEMMLEGRSYHVG